MDHQYLTLSSRTRVLEQRFFSARIAQFHRLHTSLFSQIIEKDDKIGALKKQIMDLKNKLEEFEKQNVEIGRIDSNLRTELAALNKNIKNLQVINEEQKRRIESLNIEVGRGKNVQDKAVNTKLDKLKKELDKLMEENDRLTHRNKELTDKNDKLSGEKTHLKKGAGLEKKCTEITNKYNELMKKYDDLAKVNQKQLGEFKYRNTLLEEKNALEENYRDQIASLTEKMKEHESLTVNFKIDRIKYEEKIDELTKDNMKLAKRIKTEIASRLEDKEEYRRILEEEKCRYNDMLEKRVPQNRNVVDQKEIEKKETEIKKLKDDYEYMKNSLHQKEEIVQLQNKVIKQLENNNLKMKKVYGGEQYDNDLESSLVLLNRKINANEEQSLKAEEKLNKCFAMSGTAVKTDEKKSKKTAKDLKAETVKTVNTKPTKKRKTNVNNVKHVNEGQEKESQNKRIPFVLPKVLTRTKPEVTKRPAEEKNISFFQNLTFSDSSPIIKKPFFKKP
ncbi:hypothetical protein VCUG_02595 [Vavraia culicis subsp. floridensis]|uniref:Uncharacterized protein n=1 Tax=Vavraia culicis (isolate floridensis) TaxID=948595 RepID=L2GS67_VAVCU|nr:uncharacterized protein VCUG_02595 [Vavraia culicis subsp. floridensis]ELA45915.1 hypothetical protein VCUG_02595 [Vavraia culicis subsp. floridensis]